MQWSTPPKRSRGKPALSRVPFLEGVNGDSDYNSSGKECYTGASGGTRPSEEPQPDPELLQTQGHWAGRCLLPLK